MDIAVMLRIERFRNPFFTGVAASDVLPGVSRGFFDFCARGSGAGNARV